MKSSFLMEWKPILWPKRKLSDKTIAIKNLSTQNFIKITPMRCTERQTPSKRIEISKTRRNYRLSSLHYLFAKLTKVSFDSIGMSHEELSSASNLHAMESAFLLNWVVFCVISTCNLNTPVYNNVLVILFINVFLQLLQIRIISHSTRFSFIDVLAKCHVVKIFYFSTDVNKYVHCNKCRNSFCQSTPTNDSILSVHGPHQNLLDGHVRPYS